MVKRRDSRGTLRDYAEEYRKFSSSTKAKKDRAARNRNRRQALREGRVHLGDGRELDHRDSNPRNNSRSNIRVVSRHVNRSKREDSRLKGSKRSARHKKRG